MNYLNTLARFDPQKHYLSVSSQNELQLCEKKELSLGSRLIRWFWKPKNERIEYVVDTIFTNLNSQELNGSVLKALIVL